MKHFLGLFAAFVLVVACSKNRDIYPLPPNPNLRANTTPSVSATTVNELKVDTSDPQALKIVADGKVVAALPAGSKILFANANFVGFTQPGANGELSYLMNRVARKVIEECECEISANRSFAIVKYLKPEVSTGGVEFFKTVGYNEAGQAIFSPNAKEKDGITTVISENYIGYTAAQESALYNVEKGEVMKISQAVKIDLAGGKATVWTDGDHSKTYDEKGN